MTTIHTGNTTTTGFSVTSDATGDLVIKTGGSGGTTALTVDDNQIATFANQPVVPVPAFRVYMSTSMSLTSSSATTVEYDLATFNTHPEWFNTSTHRYTPRIAGYYHITYNVSISGSSATNYYSFLVTHAGTVSQIRWVGGAGSVTLFRHGGSDLIYFDGTTNNYVEHQVNFVGSSATLSAGESITYMMGYLVRAA
jgi:hypothetical protein